MIENFLDPRFVIGAILRRWPFILIPAVSGTLLSILVALVLPPTYVASARILVESQQIPTELARSTVASDAAERIRVIEERIKSRENLLDLAQRYNIYTTRGALSPTEIVTRMRGALIMRTLESPPRRAGAGSTVSTVVVTFSADQPQVTTQVLNAVLSQVLQRNVEQRSARANETLDFFAREVERLAREINTVETEIVAFKNANGLSLPDNLEFRRNELARLQRDDYTRESRRLTLQEARETLEQAVNAGQSSLGGGSSADQELARLEAQLSQRRAIYSETHPSIRMLQAQIDTLRTGAKEEEPEEGSTRVANAASSIQRELRRIDAEMALLDQQAAADTARIAELEAAIVRAPEVGIGLSALTRRLEALQSQMQQASAKRSEAAIGERLEVSQQAERFEIIEQPQMPERPVSPNRPLIVGAGGVLSVGAGFGLLVLLELLFPKLRSPRDLERAFDIRPLITIPYLWTRRERRRRRLKWAAGLFLVAVLLPLSVFLFDQYVTPLPVLMDSIADRLRLDELIAIARQRFGR